MFGYSSMPIKITEQKKTKKPKQNKWANKYMCHFYLFMQLQDKALLSLPKNVGKVNQTAKNTKLC